MKKYVKPTVVYENFELSHSIANCNPAMNHSQDSCEYDSNELFEYLNSGETVFSDGSCTYTIEQFRGMCEDFCIQTNTDGMNLFTS